MAGKNQASATPTDELRAVPDDAPVTTNSEETPKEDNEPDEYTFSLVRNEKKVNLEFREVEGGPLVKKKFLIREMSGTERDSWLGDNDKKVGFDPLTKQTRVKDYTNIQALLISKCLYNPESGKYVPVEMIASWRCSIQDDLYKICQRINALDKAGADAAKKG